MQHLGSEVRQFRCLFKTDDLHSQRIRTDAGVGRHDAVHVGPDFDGLGMHCAADECSGEVRSAASKRRRDSGFIASDEAPEHWHFARIHQRPDIFRAPGLDQRILRYGLLIL